MNCPTAVEYHIDLDLGCRWVFFQAKVGWHGTTWLPFSAGNTQFFATNKIQEVGVTNALFCIEEPLGDFFFCE